LSTAVNLGGRREHRRELGVCVSAGWTGLVDSLLKSALHTGLTKAHNHELLEFDNE